MTVLALTALAILMTMALALCRALAGPSVYDRIVALNMFGTKTVLIIAVLAFLKDQRDVLDVALAYALINFIGVIAVLGLVQYGRLGGLEDDTDERSGSGAGGGH